MFSCVLNCMNEYLVKMQSDRDVDTGWAWVVLFASFLCLVLNGALYYGVGIVHVALLQEFGETDTFTSIVGSVYMSLLSLTGPLSSVLMNIFSCRITMIIGGLLVLVGFGLSVFAKSLTFVLLTYGIIAGIGNGLNATPPLVSTGYYFRRKRNFAIGFVVSGAGVGMFISGPLFQTLIDIYGLRGAWLVLGGLGANQIVFGTLMKPSEIEKRQHKVHSRRDKTKGEKGRNILRDVCHFSVFKEKSFALILCQFLIWNVPFAIVLIHLPNFSIVEGGTKDGGAFLLLLVGLNGTMGRMLTGLAVGPDGIDPILMNFGLTGIAGISTVLFPLYSSTYTGQCIFAVIFGMYSGGLVCMITPLIVEVLGVSKLSTAVGVMFFTGGLGHIIGPTIAGFILDYGGKYQLNFYFSGILLIVSSLLTLLTSMWRKETHETDVLADKKTLKNSTFLTQSGILAGSMIISNCPEVDNHSEMKVFLKTKPEYVESEESLNSLFLSPNELEK